MSLGARVKALRKEKGWSQSELAKKACVSQPTVSLYENEPGAAYRAEVLFKIAAALGVSPEYLKTGMGEKNLSDLPADDKEFLRVLSGMTADERAILLSVAKSMHKNN